MLRLPKPISLLSVVPMSTIPCMAPMFCVLLPVREWRTGAVHSRQEIPTKGWHSNAVLFFCKETDGSPRVSRLSLCTHALLLDPGGVLNTRHSASKTAAFRVAAHRRRSLFRTLKSYPFDHNFTTFQGSITRPVYLLGSASDSRCRADP
jgi:hypothetical protein